MRFFFSELRRRNVYRAAALYAAGGWLLVQIATQVFPFYSIPNWAVRLVIATVLVGFPIAIVLSWFYEWTPEGPKRDSAGVAGESPARRSGRKMDRWIIAMLGLAVALLLADRFVLHKDADIPDATAGKSIAVLPFANLSADKESEYFSDGISEELLNVLAKIPGLKVSARTSAFSFKGKDTSTAEIARQLGVGYVVEGSVRKSGDRVRITAQLIKASDGFQVWSNQFERDLKDIFAVQDEIAGLIAQALRLRLGTVSMEKLATGTTQNPAAYEAFLKGRQAWNSNLAAGDREAVAQFLHALELDPDFALAHGALAEAYVSLANDGVEPATKVFPLARASAERALALDDRIVQAHTALAEYAFHYEWDYEKSDRYLQRALAVDPNYSIAYTRLAGHLYARNRVAEAEAANQRARELNPLGRNLDTALGFLLLKRYDDALRAAREEVASSNGRVGPRAILGLVLFVAGRPDEAIKTLEAVAAEVPDMVQALELLGWVYGQAGQTEKARVVLQRLIAISESRYVSPLAFARVAASMNDRDLAFAQLERAFELREPLLPTIGGDTLLEPIRDDPRFRAMLKRLKLDAYFPETAKM